MKPAHFGCRLLVATSVVALTSGGSAFAQDASPPTTAAAPQASPAGELVIVTARRRPELLQNVPVAITALSGEAIREKNIAGPADLNSQVPGLTVGQNNQSRSATTFFIRGQGQPIGNVDPGVIPYFAEVPTNTTGPGMFFDLQNVQVLKGPQGTLFGRNTTGGAVLLEPQRPTNEFGGYVDVSLGDYDLRRMQAAINVPIVDDQLLVRFAFDVNERGGFTHDVTNNVDLDDVNYGSYRLGITWAPSSSFNNYLNVFYETNNTNGESMVIEALKPGGLSLTVFPAAAAALAAQQARGIRSVAFDNQPLYDNNISAGATDIATYTVNDNISLKAILGWRGYKDKFAGDFDGTPEPILNYPGDSHYASGPGPLPQEQYTGEFQVQGLAFDSKLTWTAGVFAAHIDPWPDDSRTLIQTVNVIPTYQIGWHTDNSVAVYGEATYDASDLVRGLKFTLGGRYTWDNRKFVFGSLLGAPPPSGSYTTDKADFSAPTWNANVSYNVTDDIMVYVSNRRGYKDGGFNNPNAVLNVYQPEYLTDYEIGAKTTFDLGWGNLLMDVAAYTDEYKGVQVTQYVATPPPVKLVSVTTNAAAASIKGFEGQWDFVTGPLDIDAFWAFTDSRFDNYVSPDPAGGVDVFTGQPLADSPKNKLGATVSYTTEFGNVGNVKWSANYTYQSSMQFRTNEQDDPFNKNPGYGLLNLRVDWDHVLGHPFTLSTFVTNVADENYRVYRVGPYNELGYSGSVYGAPRMWGVDLRYDF